MKIFQERWSSFLLTVTAYEPFPALKHTPGQLVGQPAKANLGGVSPFWPGAHGTEPTSVSILSPA